MVHFKDGIVALINVELAIPTFASQQMDYFDFSTNPTFLNLGVEARLAVGHYFILMTILPVKI